MEIEEIEQSIIGLDLSRNKMQALAVFALYDVLTYIDMNASIDVENILCSLTGKEYKDCDTFLKAVTIYAIKHINEEIDIFNTYMIKWKFSRLNRVEQAILLLSYTHFYYVDKEVEKNVVIDIAIRLAKTYLEDKDYKFVNAILDKVLNR